MSEKQTLEKIAVGQLWRNFAALFKLFSKISRFLFNDVDDYSPKSRVSWRIFAECRYVH